MAVYLPPGWPAGVLPPGSDGFERTAVAWLLDVVPPDYRLHGVLRRHPLALATLARYHVAACVEGARQGYRTARTDLGGRLPPPGVDAVLAAYRSEGSRLVATARAVDLILRALRGEVFVPRLRDAGRRPVPHPRQAGPELAPHPRQADRKLAPHPRAAAREPAPHPRADGPAAPVPPAEAPARPRLPRTRQAAEADEPASRPRPRLRLAEPPAAPEPVPARQA